MRRLGNTWVDHDDDACPICNSANCSFKEFEVSEIKKLKKDVVESVGLWEGVPMGNVIRKQNNKPYKQQFDDLFKSLCTRHSGYTVWSDCVHMWAYSISNGCNFQQDREERYLSIARRYSKIEINKICKLFALLVLILEENRQQDFLGGLYIEYGLANSKSGEVFTPYDVAVLMAKMTVAETDNNKPYQTVNDPTCGSGVLLIAYVNELIEKGYCPHTSALVVASDINSCVALMCYVQLALLGAAGYVCIHNSLTEPMTGNILHPPEDAFITPMFLLHPTWRMRRALNTLFMS